MRLVLDTNVVASALLWGGPPRQLLRLARIKKIEIFTSVPLLAELSDILSRKKFAGRIATSQLSADELVNLYAELAISVRPTIIPRIAPDPDDDVVLGTALAAGTEIIVTGDRTLLAVDVYQGILLLSVVNALKAIESA